MDRDYNSSMKSQFLTLWDGLLSDQGGASQVVVLGATNRREDIDEAFLRRMPLQLYVPMPDTGQREGILRILLHGIDLYHGFSHKRLAERTVGFTGSDLRELCRRVVVEAHLSQSEEIREQDFVRELKEMAPSTMAGIGHHY